MPFKWNGDFKFVVLSHDKLGHREVPTHRESFKGDPKLGLYEFAKSLLVHLEVIEV